ncbi:MAG TPA: SGNH/GDSL hydrolase family protein [Hydrogenophaga sp.]|uniref:SGNH/GDSL hydrolase family protein n=1 Tax=Hydrogenophaga sp. TaxID=1904254 RepID=UPI002B8C5A72|nr:SGNH/GDSL hydrolase family protein [Hydrogenophaga sp.]HSX93872.1 SGNH/GDSL hydrolase family protein [Hydrogenophaga sp.]
MRHPFARLGLALLLAGATALSSARPPSTGSAAPTPTQWATSWIAPAQPLWDSGFALPLGMPQPLQDVTVRQHLRVSVGGERLRLVVSNEYGRSPLRVASAHVAFDASGAAGASVAGAYASFQGSKQITVAAGAKALSDPIPVAVPAGARLRVDLYLPDRTPIAGFHWDARDQTQLLPGNVAGRAAAQGGEKLATRAFLSAVLVESARAPVAVVALGDSITDGNGSTPGADHRWPDFLARRLAPRGVAVLNAGISGNRLLSPGMGESALARLERDALQHPGVRAVIVLLGTNDIGWPGAAFAPNEALPPLSSLTDGLRQLIEQARVRGVRVIGGTLMPFEDALKDTPLEGHYSPQKEALRQRLNEWIRHAGAFDAVVDFDRLARDPSRPTRLRAAFDSGDHLHPGDSGYRAMADSIDLRVLLGPDHE